MKGRWALVALAGAQFIMVLDQSVMNVSISQLVDEFDTTVTTIQAVITLYCLVMAMLMLTGGKIGDIIGRRRAFVIGLVIYACGSGLTAVSQTVAQLTLGWSILEGIGAALVLPAMAALIAGNFEGKARKGAYAVIGGVAGAGIAIGPILGGWATTELTWRIVFVGEVVIVLGILAMTRYVNDALRTGPAATARRRRLGAVRHGARGHRPGRPAVDHMGPDRAEGLPPSSRSGSLRPSSSSPAARSCSGRSSGGSDTGRRPGPIRSCTSTWSRSRPCEPGLIGLFSQNLILMGIFFTIPLYLQLVLGLDALQTGIKMLPVSITMFITSAIGSRLFARYAVRTITRAGLATTGVAALALLATVKPDLADLAFAISMALLGVGMGLIASQLGNVVQSSVDASGRGEAGGLQYTGQQLGSSLGVALIGAIVLAGLTGTFVSQIQADERISAEIATQVGVAVEAGVDFVPSSEIEAAAQPAGLDEATTQAIVEDYEAAQLQSLKLGLLAAAFIAFASLAFTRDLPQRMPLPEASPGGRRRGRMTTLAASAAARLADPLLGTRLPAGLAAARRHRRAHRLRHPRPGGHGVRRAGRHAPGDRVLRGPRRAPRLCGAGQLAPARGGGVVGHRDHVRGDHLGSGGRGSAEYATLTAALAILAGLVSMAAGFLKLGRIAQFFSESVLPASCSGWRCSSRSSRSPSSSASRPTARARSTSSAT